MDKQKAIVNAIDFLDGYYNGHGQIEKYIDRLKKSTIRYKTYNPIWIPYESSTTYGPYHIRLAVDWYEWGNYFIHAANLLHEARHCIQYDTHGRFNFWRRYLLSQKFRHDMELDAENFVAGVLGLKKK